MTQRELADNPDFQAFCEKWREDRWCPAPIVDWLLERDMPLQAEAARWAVNTEERMIPNEYQKFSRVMPYIVTTGPIEYITMCKFHNLYPHVSYCDAVPIRKMYMERKWLPFHECIAEYLFDFDHYEAAKYPPKECIV